MKMFSKTKMISLLRKTSKRKDGELKELHGKVIIHEKDIKDEDHEIQKDKGFEAEDNLHVLDDERESSIVRSRRWNSRRQNRYASKFSKEKQLMMKTSKRYLSKTI